MIPFHKIVQIALSVVVIAVIAWIGERYRSAAGILATMPLTIPITLIIVFQNTGGNHLQVSEFAQAAVVGIIGTVCFLLAAWWAIARACSLPVVILIGYAAWALVLLIERAVFRLLA